MKSARFWFAIAAGASALTAAADARAQIDAGFATVDRLSARSIFGVDLGVGFLDFDPFDDDQSLRVDLYGQYFLDNGAGFYGGLPFSRLLLDGDDTDTALGNLEGGAFFVAPAGDIDLVLRGGIALPTADDNGEDILTNALGHSVRITDLALAYPDTTWLRLAVSPVLVSGDAFFRADVGLDLPLRTDADADPLLRINVAGGVDLDTLSLLAELALLFNADEAAGYAGDDLMTGALTARFHGAQVEPGVSVVIPINDTMRDVIDLGLLLSLQIRLD